MVGKIMIALALMSCFQVAVTQVTQADKTLIASVHDTYRSSVQSSNMMKMRYHDGIAAKAQSHADQCVFQHDTAADRALPELPGVSVGQNMAYSTGGKDWQYIINLWASEKQNFKLGVGSTNGSAVGHYTQLMLWKTQAVGCGYKECPFFKLYVCNYAYAQYTWDVQYPWKAGAQCADCPNNCNNGFCGETPIFSLDNMSRIAPCRDCNMQFCNSEYYIKDSKCNCPGWWELMWWQ